ncbi:hypothetical protein F5148DRAFT_1283672 [Russula earlei]|uniref:Uncharacterized protein n=1 Tax=Russula earlei TaxID=71964 RepID=A0ACC0UAS9_9AGAM|nr:hypothetical protein F5148DRAFT_1283672 [Russula earlei]
MPTTPTNNPPTFDKLAFRKYMKNIGRAGKSSLQIHSPMPSSECNALGSCKPTPSSILTTFINRALKIVDDALRSAAKVKNKDVCRAVNHPKDPTSDASHMKTVRDRMTEATMKDKSSSGILNTLKEKLKPAPNAWSDPMTVVEFLLFESHPHDNPML